MKPTEFGSYKILVMIIIIIIVIIIIKKDRQCKAGREQLTPTPQYQPRERKNCFRFLFLNFNVTKKGAISWVV